MLLKMNELLKQFIRLASVVLILIGMNHGTAGAGTVTLTPPAVLADGGVLVTVQGHFDTCTSCDQYGNCTSYNSGAVYLKKDNSTFSYPDCIRSGNGSATCTCTYDRATLHGTHTFYGRAADCNGSSTTSVDLTLDNTPGIVSIAPGGNTISAPFDITAHVSFTPTLNTYKGTIYTYLLYPSGAASFLRAKSCTDQECDFSYQELAGSLFDLNQGGPYKIKIRAFGGGTSSEKDGAEFFIDKTPTIGSITPGGATLSAPFDITARASFKPTLSATKGNISAYLVYSSGAVSFLRAKSCPTETCDFSYQELAGSLFDLSHGGPYKIKIRAYGGGTSSEKDGAEFFIDKTPTIGSITPGGATLSAPFDITAQASFKPTLSATKGSISAYLISPSGAAASLTAKSCSTQECALSYQDITGSLYDLNQGGPYKIRIRAYGGGTSSEKDGAEFFIDKTPTIGPITPGGATLSAPFDITAQVTFRPTLSLNKGTIYTYLIYPSGNTALLRAVSSTTEQYVFSYQQLTGSLFDLNHGGPYKIRIRAIGGSAAIEQDGPEFFIDKTPTITPVEPSGKTQSPFNIQAHATFKPTLSSTKGAIYAYLVNASGGSALIGSKSCATEDCNYHYQELTHNLYQLNPGSYQIRFRAVGGGAAAEVVEPFEVVKYANNTDGPCATRTTSEHPINYATGNKFFRQNDLHLAGPGLPLTFTRYYNSRRETASAAGYGWSTSFSRHLAFPSATTITLVHDWGSETAFKQNAQGTFVSITDEVKEITAVAGGYELVLPDGEKNYFDSSGSLTRIRDRNGNTQSLEYLSGRLAAVEDNFGRRLELMYGAAGKLERLISPAGDFQYVHDTAGNLIETSSPALTGRRYRYEDPNGPHNLTAIVDENNNIEAAVTYDKHDRALTSELADGLDQVTVTYLANQTRTLTDSRNLSKTVELYVDASNIVRKKSESGPGCASCPAGSGVAYTFDERLRITSATDALGRVTSYTYDGRGNKLTEIEAVGTAEERTTIYTYHPVYNLVASITRASVSNPGQNAVTTFTYDANGNLTSRAQNGYRGTTPIRSIITYGYNAMGQLTSVTVGKRLIPKPPRRGRTLGPLLPADGTSPNAAATLTFTYYANEQDLGFNRGQLHTVANALGHTVTFAQYNGFGKPQQVTDENGVVTTNLYDNAGRLTSKSTLGNTTSLGYDAAGNLISVTLPGGRVITYTYTPADLLETISDSLGNSIAFSYDSEGNRIREEVRDPAGALAGYLDFEYDAHNRLMKTMQPDRAFAERLYDDRGNLTQVTDPENKTTGYQYDALDRMIHVIEPGPTDTRMSYDSANAVTAVRDAEDKVTGFTYDDLGRRVEENSPDSGITAYAHDQFNNLIARTDAAGMTVTYTYDALNRLTAEQYPDAGRNVTYTYDQGANGIGRLTGMTDPSGTTVYRYNGLGQFISQERANSGMASATLSLAYDAASGELAGMVYPSGLEVTYRRDANGHISGIAADGQPLLQNVTYKPFGPLANYRIADSLLIVDRTYDLLYRLERARAGSLYDLSFDTSAAGHVFAINDLVDPASGQSFAYDSLYRLTGADGIYGSIGYAYDAAGNRQARTSGTDTDSYMYVAGSNRLAAITGSNPASYTYDAHGNMIGNGVFTFAYDQANRLSEVWKGEALVAEYGYDGRNLRVKKEYPFTGQ
jgi:YD repeat-containing protein